MTIGFRIKEQRLKNNLTQVDLANKINVSPQVFSNSGTWAYNTLYRYLMELASALKVILEFLGSGTFNTIDIDVEI
jgi:transcriptional regulator with XRE-family HTH domain